MKSRPILDLQDNFTEIEEIVKSGEAVCLTKDGCASMVVMSAESYTKLIGEGAEVSGETAGVAKSSVLGRSHDEIFFRT